MCCLTIHKNKENKIIFTHNRDENVIRHNASLKVYAYAINNQLVWMPKDQKSNGTWIATNGQITAAILNGATSNHVKKEKYDSSRGNIIMILFELGSVEQFIHSFLPHGYEPFTMLIYYNEHDLKELVWNEKELTIKNLDINKSYIYSSSTLYNESVKSQRKELFVEFVNDYTNEKDLWNLHLRKGIDHNKFLNVDVTNSISTVSISQIIHQNNTIFMYQSLNNHGVIQRIDI